MNFAQFGMFFVYAVSAFVSGVWILDLIRPRASEANRSLYLGEALLLGAVLVYGELMCLSLAGLYKAPFLWGAVLANFLFLCSSVVRARVLGFFIRPIAWDVPLFIFVGLSLFFAFRNCFFLFDIDSHLTYLYTQKMWLEHGTSLTGGMATVIQSFNPQFDAIPYGLGISIFPQETLFPALIHLFWRGIGLLLIFGYAGSRFNRWFGLAAAMFVLFDDHFFYSGVNRHVVVNGAVIAFIFAAAYNFWECRRQQDAGHLVLALVFLSQAMTNKYQMFYMFASLLVVGIFVQRQPLKLVRGILAEGRAMAVLGAAAVITSLIFIKNWIVTGIPMFPVMAGRFGALNWTPEKERVFFQYIGGLDLPMFLKYMNYFFIWHGVSAAKFVIVAVSFLPFILLFLIVKKRIDFAQAEELMYWLGLSVLFVMGIALAHYTDPRYYRFGIAILSFSAVFALNYVLGNAFNLKPNMCAGIILLLAMVGYRIMFFQGGGSYRPYVQDNIKVILDKVHTFDYVDTYYPNVRLAREGYTKNSVKASQSAWLAGFAGGTNYSPFFLPIRPQVDLWFTSVVGYDSFKDDKKIVNDLAKFGIQWVMEVKNEGLIFLSLEDFAKQAVQWERYPKGRAWDYGFPREIFELHY